MLGAALVVPQALPLYARRTWDLLRRRRAVTVRLATARITGGAGHATIKVSRNYRDDTTVDQRLDQVLEWINALSDSIAQMGSALRGEIVTASRNAEERASKLEAKLDEQAAVADKWKRENLRINGEAIPLIMAGVFLGGIPWASGGYGIAWLALGGLILVRFAVGRNCENHVVA